MAKGGGIGLWRRVRVDLDKGTAQAFMSDFERTLAESGAKGAKGLERALDEQFKHTLAKLKKDLADGLIDKAEFGKLSADAARAFNSAMSKGIDQLQKNGKLTTAEFTKLAGRLKQVKEESDDAGKSMSGMMQAFVGGLGANAWQSFTNMLSNAAGAVKAFVFDASASAAESEDVVNRLSGTLERAGVKMQDVQAQLDAGARAMQASTRFDDEGYLSIIDNLTEKTGDYSAAIREAGTVADLMAKRQLDVGAASTIVSKALADPEMSLKKLGVAAREGESAIDAIRRTFKGAAEQDGKTFGGMLAMLGNSWGNFKEAAGGALNDLLVKSGVLPRVTAWLNDNSDALSGWWEDNQKEVTQLANDLATLTRALADAARAAAATIRVTVGFSSNIARFWNSLPDWAKSYLAALVPGGAGAQGLGQINRMAAKQEADRDNLRAVDRVLDPKTATPATPGATPPAATAVGGVPARMTEEQVARYHALAQSRALTSDETARLRAEERALREEVEKATRGSEDEVDARQRLAAVVDALAGKKATKQKQQRDAEADELARYRQITEERALTARESVELEAIQQRLTRSVDAGNLSLEAEAKARQKLADLQRIMDAPREREIQMLGDIGQIRRLGTAEVQRLAALEVSLRTELSAKNLELEREITLRRLLADVQKAMPEGMNTPATIIRPNVMAVRGLPSAIADERMLGAQRESIMLLTQIAQWRALSRDETEAVAGWEGEIWRRLQNQNLTARERLDLERDLAEARALTANTAFNVDNVWESMVAASTSAGEQVADGMTDAFERIFEGGVSLKSFFDSMWDSYVGGVGKAIKAEASVRARKAGAHALEAAATGTLALARYDYVAASAAFNAIPMFVVEAAAWAALGGMAGAVSGHGGSAGRGASAGLDPGGRDAGSDAANKVERVTVVNMTNNFDPWNPDSPRHQTLMQRTAGNIVDSHGSEAFTRGNAPS